MSIGRLLHGIRIESNAPGSVFTGLVARDSGDSGIRVIGPIGGITDSVAFGNVDYGIYATGVGDAIFEANEVYGGDMDAQGAMAMSLSDTDGRVLVVNAMAGLVRSLREATVRD